MFYDLCLWRIPELEPVGGIRILQPLIWNHGDGRRHRRNGWTGVSGADDARRPPEGAVICCASGRKDCQDKTHTAPCQRRQIDIGVVHSSIVLLAPRPERSNIAGSGHVIETIRDGTGSPKFAANSGLEFVTRLNSKCGIEPLNVSVESILRHGQQTWSAGRTIFQLWRVKLEDKTIGISIDAGAGQSSHGAFPLCGADIGCEIIAGVDGRLACNVDLHPDWLRRVRADAEELSIGVGQDPETAIFAGCGWSHHIDADVNSLI